jgi:succinate dehydrogenase / fumarate reductase cytochrome b subunit
MLKKLYQSPVGKKVVTGATGLALTAFVLMHMVGNLQYLVDTDAYNEYSHFLISLGPVLWAVEIALVAFFVFHITLGINIWLGKRRARPDGYATKGSAGSPSRKSASSQSMILTGIILGVFLVIHILSFKYGTYYETTVNGVVMRDLARLMHEKFQSPLYAFGYPAVVLLLSVHLRHGIWSAFQSLGATRPSMTPVIYSIGGLLGLAIGIGFLIVPIAIYFGLI